MKTIKVAVTDFEYGSNPRDNFLVRLLQEKYEVEFSENPDFLFYSVWGKRHEKFDCVKIFYTGEPCAPDFNECDYAIGFDHIEFDDRYKRLPLFAMRLSEEIQNRERFRDVSLRDKRFCNFIYNNETVGEGALARKVFCEELMKYKPVDCPGTVLHNMDSDVLSTRFARDWYQSKVDFLKDYKFTIAFENTLINGYTTEKLIQPFLAGSIPIYFGNARVAEDFNPRAFINAADYGNDFDAVIKRVKEIDADDGMAREMLLQPPVRAEKWFSWQDDLMRFLEHIVEKGKAPFEKFRQKDADADTGTCGTRNLEVYGCAVLDEIRKYEKVYIYGDGLFGRKIGGALIEKLSLENVKGYLVTRQDAAAETLYGKPIVSIRDVCADKSTLILVAIREEAQEELVAELRENGWDNLIAVNPFLLKVLGNVI